nr:hypothetical protein [Nonomuraea diastatica]
MQRVAHDAVAVGPAEDDQELGAQVLEPPGECQARGVLHERGGEADDVRLAGQHLVDGDVDEPGGVGAHPQHRVDVEPAGLGVRAELGVPPRRVVVEAAGEDPVAQAVQHAVLGDVRDRLGPQVAAAVLHQELDPPDAAVELVHLDVRTPRAQQFVQDADGQRRPVDRLPGHGGERDAHVPPFPGEDAVEPAPPLVVRPGAYAALPHRFCE